MSKEVIKGIPGMCKSCKNVHPLLLYDDTGSIYKEV